MLFWDALLLLAICGWMWASWWQNWVDRKLADDRKDKLFGEMDEIVGRMRLGRPERSDEYVDAAIAAIATIATIATIRARRQGQA